MKKFSRSPIAQTVRWTALCGVTFLSSPLWAQEPAASEIVPSTAPTLPMGVPPAIRYIVLDPVADLRRDPRSVPDDASLKQPYDADPLQETQLLFGEEVVIKEEQGAWARVEAVEQLEFSHNQVWEGYPGWTPKRTLVPKPANYSANAIVAVKYAPLYDSPKSKRSSMELPLGARVNILFQTKPWVRIQRPGHPDGWMKLKHLRLFQDLPKEDAAVRRSIIKSARLFLREPYYWGGRCSHRPDVLERPTGVDCSGLVNLAYRVNGIDVPRDAHEQYMKSRPVLLADLKPADLIFLAKSDDPHKVTHVMIYLGGDHALEAVQEFNEVRIVSVREKVGKPLGQIAPLEAVGGRFVYLGRLLDIPSPPSPQ